MSNLGQLKNQLNNCQKCPLYKEMMVFPSIGVGSTNPDIIFVLGSVDKESVAFNKPFGSRDEAVLLTALKQAGIPSSACYVTSIIKCGSLVGNKKNAAICIDWLKQEINTLKPKCLFFLSDVAHQIYLKLSPDNNIKTFSMSAGLAGIFNKNSLLKELVGRLVEVRGYCQI